MKNKILKKIITTLERIEKLLVDLGNGSNPKISYRQSHTGARIDEWLRSGGGWESGRLWFSYGAEDLGAPWRSEIPVTRLLLAGLEKKKVKIWAEYDWNMIAGGLVFYLEKLEDVSDKDLEGVIVTMEQANRYMKKTYG